MPPCQSRFVDEKTCAEMSKLLARNELQQIKSIYAVRFKHKSTYANLLYQQRTLSRLLMSDWLKLGQLSKAMLEISDKRRKEPLGWQFLNYACRPTSVTRHVRASSGGTIDDHRRFFDTLSPRLYPIRLRNKPYQSSVRTARVGFLSSQCEILTS
jgi:hypothetical protein